MSHCGEIISVIGTITSVRGGRGCVQALLKDKTTDIGVNIVWFNQPYIEKMLICGKQYIFSGKIQYSEEYSNFSMPSPYSFSCDIKDFNLLAPVYPKVAGMSPDYLIRCIKKAVALILASNYSYEFIEEPILDELEVPTIKELLPLIHEPKNEADIALAARRVSLNKLFPFIMKIAQREYEYVEKSPYRLYKPKALNAFIESLPYKLTDDQRAAINKLFTQAKVGKRIHALVQGDVGCGKTVIATALAAAMAGSAYQTAIMCPTTVLAGQHYAKISEQLAPFDIKVGLLVSGLPAKERRKTLDDIKTGKIKVIVGTHAVLAPDVVYSRLALTIIDEEHRFGVEQRLLLQKKASSGVHSISMTATPIPRTIALTVYGTRMDIVNVKTMPTGRKPVQTILYSNEEKVYESLYRQIQAGHQCYVVCPLIEDSENLAFENVDSVEATYAKMATWFEKYPEVKINAISGNMKDKIINEKIDEFSSGKCQILISTTIIEVGIDVPNATVIVIKNAERFGLAQLHQLRGRVGRGDSQSYCVMLSEKKDSKRLQAMVQTGDGFEIAKIDLELRGTGDVVGTKQSGVDECITLMLQDLDFYDSICDIVEQIYVGKIKYDKYAKMLSDEWEVDIS